MSLHKVCGVSTKHRLYFCTSPPHLIHDPRQVGAHFTVINHMMKKVYI